VTEAEEPLAPSPRSRVARDKRRCFVVRRGGKTARVTLPGYIASRAHGRMMREKRQHRRRVQREDEASRRPQDGSFAQRPDRGQRRATDRRRPAICRGDRRTRDERRGTSEIVTFSANRTASRDSSTLMLSRTDAHSRATAGARPPGELAQFVVEHLAARLGEAVGIRALADRLHRAPEEPSCARARRCSGRSTFTLRSAARISIVVGSTRTR